MPAPTDTGLNLDKFKASHDEDVREIRRSSINSQILKPWCGGKWSSSHSSLFTLRKRAIGTHWIGGSVCTRFSVDVMAKIKIPVPAVN
jgi:hypothetical protein